MVTKRVDSCPVCADKRNKKGTKTCSIVTFETGESFKCFHCGYKKFVPFNTDRSIKSFEEDELRQEEKETVYLSIPEGELPLEDKNIIFHKYYINKELKYYVARKGSGKDKWIRPFALTESGWVMECPRNKVLYRSEFLHDDGRPVIVVEGEKAADAAANIFKNADVVSWKGGTSNVHNGDWDLLDGRTVILWPDNDEVGKKAMVDISELIKSPSVYMIDVSSLPEKADLADDLSMDTIKELYAKKTKVDIDLLPSELKPSELFALHSKKIEYVPFGWAFMDKYVKLPPSGAVVISGRTNHGKTAAMINIALNVALNTNKTVLYLTLEFPIEELNLRMVKTLDGTSYSESGWEDDNIYNDQLVNQSTEAARSYYKLLQSRKLRIADSSITIPQIIDVMNKCKATGKDLVIFVDYLQIIPLGDNSTKARYEKLKDMIELIRSVANRNSQLLVGGSQLTAGDSPFTDQVRESKDLENTAALHLKVWNKTKARNESERKVYDDIPGDIILSVEKSRQNGANGKAFGFFSKNGCKLVPATSEDILKF